MSMNYLLVLFCKYCYSLMCNYLFICRSSINVIEQTLTKPFFWDIADKDEPKSVTKNKTHLRKLLIIQFDFLEMI